MARFRGSLQPALDALGKQLVPVAGAAAGIVRDTVVQVIETSVPRGEYSHTAAGVPYRASAPGQPPASPTGVYPESWGTTEPRHERNRLRSSAATDSAIAADLEYGTSGPPPIEPRPHARPALPIAAERIGSWLQELRR